MKIISIFFPPLYIKKLKHPTHKQRQKSKNEYDMLIIDNCYDICELTKKTLILRRSIGQENMNQMIYYTLWFTKTK